MATMSVYNRRGPIGRGFALGCLLVFALVVAHLALMATDHHGGAEGHHEAATVAPAAHLADTPDVAGVPSAPHSSLDECPAQQAILPTLLFLLGLACAFRLAAPVGEATHGGTDVGRARTWSPPLAPTQRRALLQVFLI